MTNEQDVTAQVYQIRIRGCLDAHWSEWLGGLAVTHGGADGGETILRGPVADQAALHGLLIKIRDMGLPLLAVVPVEPDRCRVSAQRRTTAIRQTKAKKSRPTER